MSLGRQEHYVLEVSVVDVSVYPKQALENYLYDVNEISWEGHAELAGEHFLVVELGFDPCHQKIYVLGSAHFEWGLNVLTICPEILILGTSTHCGARLCSTKLSQNTVEHIYLIVKLDCVYSKPFIQILSRRKFYS